LPVPGLWPASALPDETGLKSAGDFALFHVPGVECRSFRGARKSAPHGKLGLEWGIRFLRGCRLHHLPQPLPLVALSGGPLLDGSPSGNELALHRKFSVRQRGAALVPHRPKSASHRTFAAREAGFTRASCAIALRICGSVVFSPRKARFLPAYPHKSPVIFRLLPAMGCHEPVLP